MDVGRIASLIGRYYAMDRDNRWDRVQLAYDLLTAAKGDAVAEDAIAGLQAAYQRGENDEFVRPTVIRAAGEADAAMQDGDALIFMNFRADRARQITRAFVNADFDGFPRAKQVQFGDFVMLTEYAADIATACAYPPASLANTFGEWLMKHDKTQLRISKPKNTPTSPSSITAAWKRRSRAKTACWSTRRRSPPTICSRR